MKRKFLLTVAVLIAAFVLSACGGSLTPSPSPSSSPSSSPSGSPSQSGSPSPSPSQSPEKSTIILATTTSTQDSGLLDYLLPELQKDTGIEARVVAVGSGKAIQMGKDGEADVLLVHARADEDKFIEEGYGTKRYDVMYNDFIIVGPAADPAAIAGLPTADAFSVLGKNQIKFVSRGDDSGTHKKELALWKQANIQPAGDWYISAGKGMGEVLTMAHEMQAYTLTDRATYLAMKDKLELKVLLEREADLLNPYGILLVNPKDNDKINTESAKKFAEWMTSEKGQKLIGQFGVNTYGEPLFIPDAKEPKKEPGKESDNKESEDKKSENKDSGKKESENKDSKK